MTDSNTPKAGLFKHKPEDIAVRKQCIIAAREYHAALERANHALQDADKMLAAAEIIEQQQYQIYSTLLKDVEQSLQKADWSVSLFFQGLGNKIKILRDELVTGLEKYSEMKQAAQQAQKKLPKEGNRCIYISLYSADGKNLLRWVGILNSLNRLSIGRPVYREEQHIIDMIRAKPDQTRDAYVAVNIDPNDIIPPIGGLKLQDRLGNELITLREGSISPQNIKEFVQVDERQKKRYRFEKEQLVLIQDEEN